MRSLFLKFSINKIVSPKCLLKRLLVDPARTLRTCWGCSSCLCEGNRRVLKPLGGSDSVGVIVFTHSSVNLNLRTESISTVKQKSPLHLQEQILSADMLHGPSWASSTVAMGVTETQKLAYCTKQQPQTCFCFVCCFNYLKTPVRTPLRSLALNRLWYSWF